MKPIFQQFGAFIISIITAIAIIATAYFAKDTEYENTWLIVFAIGSVLASFFEMYARKSQNK